MSEDEEFTFKVHLQAAREQSVHRRLQQWPALTETIEFN